MVTSGEQLTEITNSFPNVDAPIKRIEQEETTAGELTQSELKRLDDAFITPLDREDILHIMTDLYSVVTTLGDVAHGCVSTSRNLTETRENGSVRLLFDYKFAIYGKMIGRGVDK